VEQMIGVKS